jgi:uncharacterized protein (TIGR02453 family)
VSRPSGIPADAVAFYAELEANNTKDWWTANKDRYERSVREPVEALTEALAEEFGEARVFRPYRDVRFSADKTPYKTEQGAIAAAPGGAGYYLRVGSDGLVTGGGYLHGMPDQVARYRAALDDNGAGEALVDIVNTLRRKGFQIGGETLTTRPKGVAADHPRLELLRHKSLIAWRDRGTPTWMSTGSVVRYVREDWRAIRPVVEWIGEYVGESTMPKPERGRRR